MLSIKRALDDDNDDDVFTLLFAYTSTFVVLGVTSSPNPPVKDNIDSTKKTRIMAEVSYTVNLTMESIG